ncbi:hypothetical protein LXN10_01760 [Arcobacter sp. KX21116]|uniref:hypothetical protein n=1 Tax=Arcobacter iocasae TaxID=2906515 RepID=UPI0035D4F8B0
MTIFFRYVYKLLIFFSVVSGIYSLYDTIFSNNDYELNLYLLKTNKIIENNTNISDLKIIYKDTKINRLFKHEFILKNDGRKAIPSEFIHEKIKISLSDDTKLLLVNINDKNLQFDKNTFFIDFNLLNPNEGIRISILTDKISKLKLDYRIREIEKIEIFDHYHNPPFIERAKNISLWLYFLLLFQILAFFDGLFLIGRGDKKLQEIFNYINTIKSNKKFNKDEYLFTLSILYSEYRKKIHFSFFSTDRLIQQVNEEITKIDLSNEIDRYELSKKICFFVRGLNLYDLRGSSVYYSPVLVLFLVVTILIKLFYI